jgi:uncharacterized protein
MSGHIITDLTEADFPAVLALNKAHERETSPLDPGELREIVAGSFYARGAGRGADGFLIAMPPGAYYASPNLAWFEARHSGFIYVDRIIIAAHARGRGLGRRLYDDLFAEAAARGHRSIACEVDIDPPNPVSHAFHGSLGFTPVGEAVIYGGEKQVRYYMRPLP